jgi:hypothetical protein
MGQTFPYDGNAYAFIRYVKEGQMPHSNKLPEALSLREVVAAAEEELDAWYGEGHGHP